MHRWIQVLHEILMRYRICCPQHTIDWAPIVQAEIKMEKIQHNYLEVRGLKLHVARDWSRSCCGFPTWVSRNMVFLVASDDSSCQGWVSDKCTWFQRLWAFWSACRARKKTTFKDLVDNLLAILDSLELQKEPGMAEKDLAGLTLGQLWRTYTLPRKWVTNSWERGGNHGVDPPAPLYLLD